MSDLAESGATDMNEVEARCGTCPGKHEMRRIFGVLSTENVVQILALVVAVAVSYVSLSADVKNIKEQTTATRAKLDAQDASISAMASKVDAASIVNAQHSAEIAALQQGRDADRKLLMDINANIAVLLDRTDPKKAK